MLRKVVSRPPRAINAGWLTLELIAQAEPTLAMKPPLVACMR